MDRATTAVVIPGRVQREPGIHTHDRAAACRIRENKERRACRASFCANGPRAKRAVVMDSGPACFARIPE
jgi:hypothetical protein